eukprot:7764881-Alexandrium_andersonii.AAC.1
MSASLVGSEMCIRDSSSPNGPNGPLRGSESASIGARPYCRSGRRRFCFVPAMASCRARPAARRPRGTPIARLRHRIRI